MVHCVVRGEVGISFAPSTTQQVDDNGGSRHNTRKGMLGFKAGGSPSPSIPRNWRRIGKAKFPHVWATAPKIQISRLTPMNFATRHPNLCLFICVVSAALAGTSMGYLSAA